MLNLFQHLTFSLAVRSKALKQVLDDVFRNYFNNVCCQNINDVQKL